MLKSTKLCYIAVYFALCSIPSIYFVGQLPAGFFFADPIRNAFANAAVGTWPLFIAIVLMFFAMRAQDEETVVRRIEAERPWREWQFKSTRVVQQVTAPENHFRSTGGGTGGGTGG